MDEQSLLKDGFVCRRDPALSSPSFFPLNDGTNSIKSSLILKKNNDLDDGKVT